jgi:hypothetical protein
VDSLEKVLEKLATTEKTTIALSASLNPSSFDTAPIAAPCDGNVADIRTPLMRH